MNRAALTALLLPLIGFRENPNLAPFPEELKGTTTGQYVDGLHELLSTPRLLNTAKPFSNQIEATDWLAQKRNDAISAVLTAVEGRFASEGWQSIRVGAKPLLTEIANPSPIGRSSMRRLGLLLELSQQDVSATIKRIRLTTSLPATLTVYLVEEGSSEAIATMELTSGVWTNVNWPSLSPDTAYSLVYLEDDLGTAGILNTLGGWPKAGAGCGNCTTGLCNYVKVSGLVINAFGLAEKRLDANFGLNVVMEVRGDASARLIQDPALLMPAYAAQLKHTLLNAIAFSERHSGQADEAMTGAIFSLYDKDNKHTVVAEVQAAIDKMVLGLSKQVNPQLSESYVEQIEVGHI
ncbi:hypothetical protein [Tellurirhabdus bombi]|uniref:hypothetical protein n=1 Tax=Tellurirhabdus bombi TaxID=2907205 RepID=UPI001F426ADE|nr:hypothetical protein [Tellurirhabdus bombi]